MPLLSLPAFLTRRREDTPMTETTAPAEASSDVLMRFATQGGATVIVTGSGRYAAEDHYWKCLGCNDGSRPAGGRYDWWARDAANEHATNCRSMPKPGA